MSRRSDDAEAIAAVEGIDAIFIGRIDLTVSLGCESPDDPAVIAAVREVCAACRKAIAGLGCFFLASKTCRSGWPRA
jgi:2-keto-3-deoxy-L-rhamnonate aldolase RhmA